MSATTQTSPARLDVAALRDDFPILHQMVNGKPLAYLDNAASSQRPRQVTDAVTHYDQHDHANIHRGVHTLSQRATDAFEGARKRIAAFINAASEREIIFTRGTTEAINLVAQSYARPRLGPGDQILITWMEHHSNIVPWQMVCEQTGAELIVAPIDDRGQLRMDEFERLLGPRTRLVAAVHVSNALGTINPVEDIVKLAHSRNVPVLLDGAQALPHGRVDVRALGCDFYAFSGHKMYGPTGIGALYGREQLLEEMPPWQGGGDMIRMVRFDRTEYNDLPWKFEAGTPNISGAVGLGAAVDYLESVGMDAIAAREAELLEYATQSLLQVPGLRLIGTAEHKASLVSFVLDGVHPHDIGTIVDHDGIAVRTGHHCAMPVMEFFGIPATARASFALYNTEDEIDRLAESLSRAREVFT
ncbi:MAG: cysteine desulfurase [Gammaproteobacteria bacterium]